MIRECDVNLDLLQVSHHVLVDEQSLALLLPLGQSHIYGLGVDDATVHLSDGSGGFFRRREADESEASAAAAVCHHLNEEKTLDLCIYWETIK